MTECELEWYDSIYFDTTPWCGSRAEGAIDCSSLCPASADELLIANLATYALTEEECAIQISITDLDFDYQKQRFCTNNPECAAVEGAPCSEPGAVYTSPE